MSGRIVFLLERNHIKGLIFISIFLLFVTAVPVTQGSPYIEQKNKINNINIIKEKLQKISNNNIFKTIQQMNKQYYNETQHQEVYRSFYTAIKKSITKTGTVEQFDGIILLLATIAAVIIEFVSIVIGHNAVSFMIGYLIASLFIIVPEFILGFVLGTGNTLMFASFLILDPESMIHQFGIIGSLLFMIFIVLPISLLLWPYMFSLAFNEVINSVTDNILNLIDWI